DALFVDRILDQHVAVNIEVVALCRGECREVWARFSSHGKLSNRFTDNIPCNPALQTGRLAQKTAKRELRRMSHPPTEHFALLGISPLPAIQVAALADADPSLFIPEYTLQTYSVNFLTSGEMAGTLNGAAVHMRPGRLILWLPGDRIMLRGVQAKGRIVCRWATFTW